VTTELEVLAALADPTRWHLLDTIGSARAGATATVLAADLPVSRQAVVKHLGVLERAGLIAGRRAGREMRYSVRVERLDATARWMTEAARRWDQRLAAIKQLAESLDEPGRAAGTG
jgi:DNA-binding transcriptional ArsR family regulator